MAGDWIKMEVGLPEKPEVWQIAGMVGIDADSVVGKLLKVWRWFDAHTESGKARGTKEMLDAICGQPGFADAMVAVGWLNASDGYLIVVNFDKHNGKTGKVRAETARRVAKHRKDAGNNTVTNKTLPRPVVRAIKDRDGACVYCSRKEGEYTPPETPSDALMCIDHVVPKSRGGTDDENNLVCACSSCNLYKSNRTPDECGLPWPLDESGNRRGVTSALAREEKRREEKEEKNTPPSGDDLFAGISPQIAKDFKAIRKAKKAPVTQTAIDGIRREAEKAGLTLESALAMCCERGWSGFKAVWVTGQGSNREPAALPRLRA